MNGTLTNFQFERVVPNSQDPAIRNIDSFVWTLYDDFNEHRAEKRHRLTGDEREALLRALLFLRSDEFKPAPLPPAPPNPVWNWLFCGRPAKAYKVKREEMKRRQDFAAWPFRTLEDYRIELEAQSSTGRST